MIQKTEQLDSLCQKHPPLANVLQRYGLDQFNSETTVEQACSENGFNAGFLAEILYIYTDISKFSEEKLTSFSIPVIIDFLQKTHQTYRYRRIPEIEKSIFGLVKSPGDSVSLLAKLNDQFTEIKNHLLEHMYSEENQLFPYILYLDNVGYNEFNIMELHEQMENHSVAQLIEDHNEIENELEQLRDIIRQCDPPTQKQEDCVKLDQQLKEFLTDLQIHRLVEDKVLGPKAADIEQEVKQEIY